MATIIYDYPKSSCNTYMCNNDDNVYEENIGYPSNIGIRQNPGKCENSFPECYTMIKFKESVEPSDKSGYDILNPNNMTFSKEFGLIKKCKNGCEEEVYTSADPRLYDPVRAIRTHLDRPPYQNNMYLKDINESEEMEKYTSPFDYTTAKGQITYYYNKAQEDAYFKPVFDKESKVEGYIHKDPMDNVRPRYNRISSYNPLNYEGKDCLSDIWDSNHHREDIMTHQQTKNNSQKWMPRWTNNI